jgi:F-type H+-transporting ATPase subunit b
MANEVKAAPDANATAAPATGAPVDHAAMGHTQAGGEPGAVSTEREVIAGTTVDGAEPEHAVPSAFGFDATMLVALAMLVVIGLAIWKKVPAMIAGALDKQIAGIKEQLDAATNLRAEAEAIKAEYEAKAVQAAADAETMKANAAEEAKLIIANAKKDATAMVARRAKMAEDKIAAAETAAIADVRGAAAATAAAAAEHLIISSTDANADATLIDASIASLN